MFGNLVWPSFLQSLGMSRIPGGPLPPGLSLQEEKKTPAKSSYFRSRRPPYRVCSGPEGTAKWYNFPVSTSGDLKGSSKL